MITSAFFAVMLKSKRMTTIIISGIPLCVHVKSLKRAPCTVPRSQTGVSAISGGGHINRGVAGQVRYVYKKATQETKIAIISMWVYH